MNVNDFAESSQKRALEANFELTIYTIFYKWKILQEIFSIKINFHKKKLFHWSHWKEYLSVFMVQ